MSSSRRSRPSSSSSRLATAAPPTDEQIAELISKLQAVLPTHGSEANGKVSSAEVLQEACRYIRRLHREADALSERLAELLLLQPSDRAINGADASDLIRSLLMETYVEKESQVRYSVMGRLREREKAQLCARWVAHRASARGRRNRLVPHRLANMNASK